MPNHLPPYNLIYFDRSSDYFEKRGVWGKLVYIIFLAGDNF